jgi:uncharacterized protein HemX
MTMPLILLNLLKKPFIVTTLLLSLGLGLLGSYTYYIKNQNFNLTERLNITKYQLDSLDKSVKIEREQYKNSLSALALRDKQKDALNKQTNALRKELDEALKKNSDKCASSPIPDDVLRLFTTKPTNGNDS